MRSTRNTARRALTFFSLVALLAATVLPASAQTRRRPRIRRTTRTTTRTVTEPAVRYFSVDAETVIRARMDSELSSQTARVGDRFTATVTEPVYGGGVEVAPVGSKVHGRVSSVRRAGRRTPGSIQVSFNQLQLPNGARHTINGSLTTLQADDVQSDNEGAVRGRSNRNRDAVFIGGGAATGAIIGAIAGGGKGAAIGAILGGGLGTGARVYEKEQDAEVKSGTEFGVILNRAVSLPEYRQR
jgi:hypothetical protein